MSVNGDNQGVIWRFLVEPCHRAERECREHVAVTRGPDGQTIAVLLTTAVTLTIQQYIFTSSNLPWFEQCLTAIGAFDVYTRGLEAVGGAPDRRLAGLLFWAAGSLVTYVLLPAFVIRSVLRRRVRDFGLSVRGILGSSWVYLAMLLVMVPILFYFSGSDRFLHTYPFYKPCPGEPLWPAFVTWQLFYWGQFIALEFFFRGFLVHGLRHRFGIYSIFVMTVPYCMIHFGKPLPETFAAIVAGIVLGFMSLKTRSIWLGAALHIAVAATMDWLALWRWGHLG
jgi:membrane protease YdiL (CAAX protease family)